MRFLHGGTVLEIPHQRPRLQTSAAAGFSPSPASLRSSPAPGVARCWRGWRPRALGTSCHRSPGYLWPQLVGFLWENSGLKHVKRLKKPYSFWCFTLKTWLFHVISVILPWKKGILLKQEHLPWRNSGRLAANMLYTPKKEPFCSPEWDMSDSLLWYTCIYIYIVILE